MSEMISYKLFLQFLLLFFVVRKLFAHKKQFVFN